MLACGSTTCKQLNATLLLCPSRESDLGFFQLIKPHYILDRLILLKNKLNLLCVVQVLENDEANVSVLVQRALLYESMEKYRLGAEDLRTVLKIDPSNRIARSTIHRLTKLAD